MCEQRRTDLFGTDLEEDDRALLGFWFVSEDGDVAIGVLTMDDVGAGQGADAESFDPDRNSAVGADFDGRTHTPDKGPPRAAGGGAQDIIIFAQRPACGLIRGVSEFAVDFLGVAVAAECGQKPVGGFRIGDGFGGEESGQSALPVLVLPLNFSLGLRCAGVAQGDTVEVERGSELSERVRALGKEHTVAVDVQLQGEAVFGKGGGEEVQISEQIFPIVDGGSGADAGAVI